MKDLKRTLMERDDLSSREADELIEEVREAMMESIESGEGDAEEIFTDMTGLEPDYIFDVL